MLREIVHIDEELCDGCGLCIPSCAEGALQIVDGKAKLIADKLCDGMGACLGHCPKGAIKIEHREAPAFDEQAVHEMMQGQRKLQAAKQEASCPEAGSHGGEAGGCPGSRFKVLTPASPAGHWPGGSRAHQDAQTESMLGHWPVQLRLLSPHAPVLRGAHLLVAADCVPVACPGFHERLLAGKAVAISCPKFDDLQEAVERLTAIFAHNELAAITVARMSVPCCAGISKAVLLASQMAGATCPIKEVVIEPGGSTVERPLE